MYLCCDPALCLQVVVSGVSGERQGPLELLRDELTRSPTSVKTDASQVLAPAPEEQTDQPSTPLVPYDPVELFSLLLQLLASAIEKVGSLSFWHASILIGSITSVTGVVNGLLHIFIATFYTYIIRMLPMLPTYVMAYIQQKTFCVHTYCRDAILYLVYACWRFKLCVFHVFLGLIYSSH